MGRAATSPEELRSAIEEFLESCREPALIEPGEEPIRLMPGYYSLSCQSGRVLIEAWDDQRNIARRLSGLGRSRPGRLETITERFGKRSGTAVLIDQDRPGSVTVTRQGHRQVFRERFRRFLSRQFPGWKLSRLSTEGDLEHSLSPVYPRALLRKGPVGWAALGAPPDGGSAAGALTFGLIWLDHLRVTENRLGVEGLVLFLPAGHENTSCLRIRWLDGKVARYAIFVYSQDGHEEQVDPRDHGNLETCLEPCRSVSAAGGENDLAQALRRLPGVEVVDTANGQRSFRVRGLEFARAGGGRVIAGVDRRRTASPAGRAELAALAAELARMRCADAPDPSNPICRQLPESWLEAQVRASISVIDAELETAPLYGQVPAITGLERGVLDLLSIGRDRRLAVLELKATADLQLPVQALDYWLRVSHHHQAGDFPRCGYFPGIEISPLIPRLLLVAPALEFHPTTETVLRFFDPAIPVSRVGLGSGWRRDLSVVFRADGAEKPGM